MAITASTQTNTFGVSNTAVGKFTTDAVAAVASSLTLAFTPRYFKLVNLTDRITDEWFEGMASASSLHAVATGVLTFDLVNGITVSGGTVTLTAVTLVASKSYTWVAIG